MFKLLYDLMLKVAIMLLSPPKYLFSTEIAIWTTALCWSPSQIFFIDFFFRKIRPILTQKYDFESMKMFEEVVHNFGESDDDMI